MRLTLSQKDELYDAYTAGYVAGASGGFADEQPYGQATPGFRCKKVTAWFFGYMDSKTTKKWLQQH